MVTSYSYLRVNPDFMRVQNRMRNQWNEWVCVCVSGGNGSGSFVYLLWSSLLVFNSICTRRCYSLNFQSYILCWLVCVYRMCVLMCVRMCVHSLPLLFFLFQFHNNLYSHLQGLYLNYFNIKTMQNVCYVLAFGKESEKNRAL